ncbi:hypothetical protein JCM3770_004655 [Rhodotorula araucariae]
MAPVAGSSGEPIPLTKLTDAANRWSAWVSIDDKPVEVYKVEHKDAKTTCYVEAVEGKECSVCFTRATPPATDIAVYLKLDGTDVAGFSLPKSDLPGRVDTFQGARISPTAIRPFKFAQIAPTDDPDEANNTEAMVKNLGTIQLETYRTQIIGRVPEKKAYQDVKQHVVDEKSKKATMSHSTAYGDAQASVQMDIVKPRDEASPSPGPDASTSGSVPGSGAVYDSRKKRKSSAISLSDDDADEDLRSKIARLESEILKLKSDVKREKGDVKPKVKGEPIGKVSTENGRTVIDLLDEEDD